jgi:lipase
VSEYDILAPSPGAPLQTYRFGPAVRAGDTVVLAVHGLTGHGLRWRPLAVDLLADVPILAPDLRGHGRSPWTPPWSLEQHVRDLQATIAGCAKVLLVGHSFGGALSLFLAAAAPQQVVGLILLDPAIALDPDALLEVAEATVAHPDYTDAAEARSDKVHGAWGDVAAEVLEEELSEHLVALPNGRCGWRISTPAIAAEFGELARDFVLPPAHLPTVLVQAMRVQPPYVTPALRSALQAHLGPNLRIIEADCDHMVPQAKPALVATLIREALGR